MDLKLPTVFCLSIIFVNSQLTYKKWQSKYNINNSSNHIDYVKRRQAFDISVAFLCVNKLRYDFGYELELNEFSDIPFQYFERTYNGLVLPEITSLGSNIIYNSGRQVLISNRANSAHSIPSSVDYRNYSLPVQNQKLCNSCWAISVLEALRTST